MTPDVIEIDSPSILASLIAQPGMRSPNAPEYDLLELSHAALQRFAVFAPIVDQRPVGYMAVEDRTMNWYDYHGAILPGHRGEFAIGFLRYMLRLLFAEEPQLTIITTHTPANHLAAQRFNVAAGLGRMGRIPRAEDGNDFIIYGITREVFHGN